MLQLLSVRETFLGCPLRRRLLLQPANTRKETEGPSFSFYLQTKQPCHSISATFQLWLVNQQDPKKTIQKGAVKGFCQDVDSFLSMYLHLAEVQHCFAENELDWGYFHFSQGQDENELDWGYFHFSQGQEVLDKTNGFVKEGRLLVGVHMSVTNSLKGIDQHQNPSAVLNCSLNHSFADLYNNALLSDVILKAGDCQVHAHRLILAAQSPSFKAMFQCGMREESMGTIELGDMQGPVLEVLMEYLYGCLTEVPAQLLLPLFVAADAHQVQSLRQLCIEHIMYSLTVETVLTYAVTAHSLSDASLLDACWTFIKTTRNSVAVVQQPAMQQILQHQPELAHKLLLMFASTNTERK